MDLPTIPVSDPVVIPPVEQQTYDFYWMSEMKVVGNDPNAPVVAIIHLIKACTLSDGTIQLLEGSDQYIRIDDLLNAATTDSDLANIVTSILNYATKIGTQNNIL